MTTNPQTDDRRIRAPWTPEQVTALNDFQQRGGMHPFTCGADHPGPALTLVAREDGWHCWLPGCDYRQDWAHAFMAAVSVPAPAPTDQATIYAEVADRLAADAEQGDKDGLTRIYRRSAATQVRGWADELRRAAAASGSGRVADETQAERAHRCGNCEGVDPGTCLRNPNRAVVSQPDGEQRCPAKHGALGRICELPTGHDGMHTGSGSNGGAVWDGDAP